MAFRLSGIPAYWTPRRFIGRTCRLVLVRSLMKLFALIFFALIFSGCSALGEDNRERIAMETLYPESAPPSQVKTPVRPFPALASALNGRFPSGTDSESLKDYVKKLGGSCIQSPIGQPLQCSIIESSTICIRNSVSITAKTNGLNKIESIDAVRIIDVC